MESEKIPTLHEVINRYHVLHAYVSDLIFSEQDKEMKFIATFCETFLQAKFKFSSSHKIATFLAPCFRQLQFLQDDDIEREVCGFDSRPVSR